MAAGGRASRPGPAPGSAMSLTMAALAAGTCNKNPVYFTGSRITERVLPSGLTGLLWRMELIPDPALEYQRAYGRKLMVLTKLRNVTPERDEFCRIRSAETLPPGLWISATFLDGSTRRFRPEKIRPATPDEERIATELPPFAQAS